MFRTRCTATTAAWSARPRRRLSSRVRVAPGDLVRAGDPLVVVESMKMETTITAPYAGTVRAVTVGLNTQVEAGAPVVQLQALTARRARPGAPASTWPASPGPARTAMGAWTTAARIAHPGRRCVPT